ncbi:Cof-type HAD-IIB family hydrolase [Salinimicrobium xinjiangense]|uniref:Cof-type HAD-IIB family hydrolase n=1 Tax=Salinimicrobium xinjiangense TaxID=438596 RepID=UPI000403629A|nr:Cof-type HAD-IIB family hydrolase [Salinimicrobium xinjiangense]
MNYKIVFSDIDGTLLNKDRELSPLTLRVIRKLQKQVPVVLISSRMPQAMQHLQEELHIGHQPLICYNGGQVIVNGETVSSTEIPWETIWKLHTFNKNFGCHLSLFNDTEWYVPQMDFWAKREQNNTKVIPQVKPVGEVLRDWKKSGKGAHKIQAMGEPDIIDALEKFLFSNYKNHLHLYRSKDTYLEIANKEVSKLTAIKVLLDSHFNFNLQESIAFGDNFNDYEMLKAVGMGIAVGNAKPKILKIAKKITGHGKEDGVAISRQELFNLF